MSLHLSDVTDRFSPVDQGADVPTKYRKKPVEIEAVQWDGTASGATPIIDWIIQNGERTARYHSPTPFEREPGSIAIDTLEGTMRADPGDWIIRGVKGEFYPCKPDIFEATYDGEYLDYAPIWEYHEEGWEGFTSWPQAMQRLANLGDDGWELAAIVEPPRTAVANGDADGSHRAIFKRLYRPTP